MKRVFAFIAFILLSHTGNLLAQAGWTQKASFGAGATTEARAFSIGSYGYFGGPTADLWRYDPVTDSWSQMATFIGTTRSSPFAFAIGNKGYIGTGGGLNDFYEYDSGSNTWTQLANFGGSGREGAVGIAIDGKGYAGTGGNYLNDWWEYDPGTNAWTQKANLGGPGRYHAGAFALNGKGYVCTGFNGSFFNDLLEFDPVLNSWTTKAPMPGSTRDRPVGLATASKGYILTGWTGSNALNDLWEYDPIADSWTGMTPMATAGRYNACGFVISSALFIGTGYSNGTVSDFWQYGSACTSQVVETSASCPGACDGTANVSSPDPGAVFSYLWSNGQSNSSVINLCAGTYSVTVTDTSGCVSNTTFIISEPPPIPLAVSQIMPTCSGDSDGFICVTPGTNPFSLMWANGVTSVCISNLSAGIYTVTVTDSTGCSTTTPIPLTEPAPLMISFTTNNATCSTCANGTASAQVTGGTPPLQYSWSVGSSLAFINNLLPGTYQCCVSDSAGCFVCDSVEVFYTVGLEETGSNSIIISPNPFNDFITIEFNDSNIGDTELKIYDITGKSLLYTSFVNSQKHIINTSSFKAGVYLLELNYKDKQEYKKIVKSK